MSGTTNDELLGAERKQDALRELFDSCADSETGLIDFAHLSELLILIHAPKKVVITKDMGKAERVRIVMLHAAIDTITTFSKNAGVDFQAFVRFYNHLQKLGIDLLTLNDPLPTETNSAEITRSNSEKDIETIANEIYLNFDRELAETRRQLLKAQGNKATTIHTNIVSSYNNPYKPAQEIDYFTIIMSAEAFQKSRRAACYHIELTKEIIESLHGHVDDMLAMDTLSDSLAKFAHNVIDQHDMTAIFSFYKFAYNDTAMRTYLMFKKGEYSGIVRSARKKYMLARKASYQEFVNERRKTYETVVIKAKEKAMQPLTVQAVQEPLPRRNKGRGTAKKKRWMILYEDALRRIQALKALEATHGK